VVGLNGGSDVQGMEELRGVLQGMLRLQKDPTHHGKYCFSFSTSPQPTCIFVFLQNFYLSDIHEKY
jgi:hypothetical protein